MCEPVFPWIISPYQDPLDVGFATKALVHACVSAFNKVMCGQVLVLPSRRLVRPAPDDDFVKGYCRQQNYKFQILPIKITNH